MLAALIVLAGATAGWCAQTSTLQADKQDVAKANNAFAVDLYGQLRAREGNLFFSPHSISTALAMTYGGARGKTAEQMAEVLRITLGQERLHPACAALVNDLNAAGKSGNYLLSVANALWVQKEYQLVQEFLDLIQETYGGGLYGVDFARGEAARQTINSWVERQTQDKIKDLIPPGMLNAATRLVLTNAIYFKGNWASQFKPASTRKEQFSLLSGQKVITPMMRQTQDFGYMENGVLQVLEMPYVNNELSMIVVLPNQAAGLPQAEGLLTMDNLAVWLSEIERQEVIVTVPKFKMTSSFKMKKVLQAMGMKDAFTSAADFTGITAEQQFQIGEVIHKAFVDVNETGTEAAAATAVVGLTSAPPPKPKPVFRADHPFLFMIRDNRSGSVLFMGRVMDPR